MSARRRLAAWVGLASIVLGGAAPMALALALCVLGVRACAREAAMEVQPCKP